MKESDNRITIAALMAHAPVLIPAIAASRAGRARASIAAMIEAARRVVATAPDVVVLISPHTVRRHGAFAFWMDDRVNGSLTRFGSPDVVVDLPNDGNLAQSLTEEAGRRGLQLWPLRDAELDHGAIVPLWHLQQAGWSGPTLLLGLNYPGEPGLIELGEAIAIAARRDGRRVAVVASGDMSHRLKPGSPGGYHPEAAGFDQSFIECLRVGDYRRLMGLDPDLQELAGEDVVDTALVAVSAVDWNSEGREVLSYEGPFGVGYGIAILHSSCGSNGSAESLASRQGARLTSGKLLPRIARHSIEAALRGDGAQPNFVLEGILAERFGVFVTIRGRTGELRGCVGTISPRYGNTLEETWHLAREAAFRDHRFEPVRPDEVGHSRFEVSVVFPPEPILSIAELDPQRYGVLVATLDGRRGALLPALDGVETREEQLDLARRKGGIGADEATLLQRFAVEKYSEENAATEETG